MVLVQWRDLPLEEASWEEWTAFKKLHHLEDKVFFEGQGSVTSNEEGLQIANSVANNEEGLQITNGQQHEGRPKRKTKTPVYMEDYVQFG